MDVGKSQGGQGDVLDEVLLHWSDTVKSLLSTKIPSQTIHNPNSQSELNKLLSQKQAAELRNFKREL